MNPIESELIQRLDPGIEHAPDHRGYVATQPSTTRDGNGPCVTCWALSTWGLPAEARGISTSLPQREPPFAVPAPATEWEPYDCGRNGCRFIGAPQRPHQLESVVRRGIIWGVLNWKSAGSSDGHATTTHSMLSPSYSRFISTSIQWAGEQMQGDSQRGAQASRRGGGTPHSQMASRSEKYRDG